MGECMLQYIQGQSEFSLASYSRSSVSTALTSYRQKGFDPYAETKSGPVINAKSISANAVFMTPNRGQQGANKRRTSDPHATLPENSRRAPDLPAPLLLQLLTPTPKTADQELPKPNSLTSLRSAVPDVGQPKHILIASALRSNSPADQT